MLAAAAAGGYTRSALTVDGANATGALGVHSRAGYELRRREVSYSDV